MGDVAGQSDQRWFSRERVVTLALAAATLLALYVCYLIIQPFIPTLAIALALVVSTHTSYRWLLQRLENETLAATIAVILVACVIIIPLALLITYITQQVLVTLADLQGGSTWTQWRDAVYGKPVLGDALRWAESNLDLETQLTGMAKAFARRAGSLLKSSLNALTQLVIMLFVLFFLYRDGNGALSTLRCLVPLSDRETNRMFERVGDTIVATVNGSMIVALVQSALAGAMYTILGVPVAILWSAVTFMMALVPVFGTSLVWGPIAAYLALSGSWVKALVLIGWGLIAIGTIDNILYPYLVGDRLRLHTVPTFFALLGGIGLFGPAGLILGPMVLAITIGLLQVWWSRTEDGRTAEQSDASASHADSPSHSMQTRHS
jgi:predicted PurR-regulated permease PerM